MMRTDDSRPLATGNCDDGPTHRLSEAALAVADHMSYDRLTGEANGPVTAADHLTCGAEAP